MWAVAWQGHDDKSEWAASDEVLSVNSVLSLTTLRPDEQNQLSETKLKNLKTKIELMKLIY